MSIDLIAHITSLSTIGDPIPVSSKNPALPEEIIGSWASKKYKGFMINHTTNMAMKWIVVIV